VRPDEPALRVPPGAPFHSFFMAGFECSTQRRMRGRRADLIAATGHDRWVAQDYGAVRRLGLATVRDGFRWHLIETAPGRYDWSSVLPMLRAARACDVQVIWDLCHYGWPDDLDFWSPDFVARFASFAAAAARLIAAESGARPWVCPVNEISYWSWAGGQMGRFNPHARGRGPEAKRQLVRAALAGVAAIRAAVPEAGIVHVDPVIQVRAHPDRPQDRLAAERHRRSQFEAWDMLAGRLAPELGGSPEALGPIGVNYYPANQWYRAGPTIPVGHPDYRPFRSILLEVFERYGRPLLIAETGAEGAGKAPWLRYVCGEARAAMAAGCPILGVCIYPVTWYPGWTNGRICRTGLLGRPDAHGRRPLDVPLVEELRRQQQGRPAAVAATRERRRALG
jgi:hypothetical protein